jgi:hypothetical protein
VNTFAAGTVGFVCGALALGAFLLWLFRPAQVQTAPSGHERLIRDLLADDHQGSRRVEIGRTGPGVLKTGGIVQRAKPAVPVQLIPAYLDHPWTGHRLGTRITGLSPEVIVDAICGRRTVEESNG